jgi:hypothetical protein
MKNKQKIYFAAAPVLFLLCFVLSGCCRHCPAFEVPFTLSDNHIIVEADVNGRTGKYLFDTGAGPFLITRNSVDNLESAGVKIDSLFLNGEFSTPEVKKLDSIRLCGTVVKNDFMIVHNTNLVYADIDGILGLPVFSGYYLEISYSGKKLKAYKERPERYSKKIPLEYADGMYPVIQCYIDGHSIPFLIDTGSSGNILFPLPGSTEIPAGKYTQIHNCNNTPYYRVKLDSCDLRFQKYENITGFSNINGIINYAPVFEHAGNIGADFLKHYNIVFDCKGYRNTLLYYRHNTVLEPLLIRNGISTWFLCGRPNTSFNKYGIDSWNREHDFLLVTSVLADGPAERSGIKCGTRITEINGQPVSRFSKHKLETVLLFSGKPLELTIQDENGSDRVVQLHY